jgi:hypothetical protein
MDSLEEEIRNFAFSNTGPVTSTTLGVILLEMLNRIQELEAKLKEKNT